MHCSLDWLCDHVAIARMHPTGGLGDPWTYFCVVERRGDTAWLYVKEDEPGFDEARALIRALRESGMPHYDYDRRNVRRLSEVGLTVHVRGGRRRRKRPGWWARLKGWLSWRD